MDELMTKSLARIVTENHLAASVLEKYHLDFCCKGKRSLQQACEENKLNATDVVRELQSILHQDSSTTAADYNSLSLAQLAGHIVAKHHDYVKKEMPQILEYLQRVATKHGERHPVMRKVLQLFAALKEEMEQHMKKEELVLFPRIKEIENMVTGGKAIQVNNTYLQAPISMMEYEHDHAGQLMEEIRQLTGDYTPPADACTTFRLSFTALQAFEADLHQHVHLENNILFPRALKLFKAVPV